ncbi:MULTISPECIES: hypothetical protein [Salimicrobium]|uniref:Bacteriophage lambda head decoration protein D n=1 Tax=Salimicrobium album TaxID=50717 RepID=A0A1H3D887_9BACI|nr:MULTISPECIES: hypothetical protein [Salimicrobium]SDX62546.1 hypothetical protein SAMN04488081_0866 [Salimicrobium album]
MYVNNQRAQQIEFLASSHYVNFTKEISDSGVTADENGKKIVPAGSVYPVNDGTAVGIVFHDVDVTQGPAAGAVMVEGYVLEARLPEAPVQLAKDAMTEIKFR